MLLINSLLPGEFSWQEFPGPGADVSMIQLNCFDCSGITISVMVAHCIADLTSICLFLRTWAATARGLSEVAPLNCIAKSMFPQKFDPPNKSNPFQPPMKFSSIGKFVTRRYAFDAASISTLEARSNGLAPTRVVAVTALIWKCVMAAAAERDDVDQKRCPFLLTHAIKLRKRAELPLPEDSFCNFLWPAPATCTNHMEKGLRDLVNEVKEGISRIDKEFIELLQSDHGYDENLDVSE